MLPEEVVGMGNTLPIVGVTVHPDGALVHRAGPVSVDAGGVRIHELPLLLDEASVRVSVSGAPLGDLRLDLDLDPHDRAAEADSAGALRKARAELEVLDATVRVLSKQRSGLVELTPRMDDEDELPSATRVASWVRLEAPLEAWASDLDDRLRDLRQRRRPLAERIATLEWELSQQSSEAWWRRWCPTRRADLRIEGDGTVQVELSYKILGATWTPAYALEADAALREGRFTMRALVVQATGEDWSGVALRLSTAPCRRVVDLPELPALKLGARQPPAKPAWRDLPPDLDSLFPDDLSAAPEPVVETVALEEPEPEPNVGAAPDDFALAAELDMPAPPPPVPALSAVPMPQAAPASLAAPRSRGGLVGSLMSGMAEAAASVSTGAPPPERAKRARRHAPEGGGGAPGGPPPPAELEVGGDLLDYGAMRLSAWDQPAGKRGRLRPLGRQDLLQESGLPPVAQSRYRSWLDQLTDLAWGAQKRPLPPHHVLPGPVGGSDFAFDAGGQVDVPADGRFHSVSVLAEPVELRVNYRTVPRADPRAFRTVVASLTRSAPLLAGPVDVYVDGALEVTTPWEGTPGRGRIELGLGVEDRITVARNVRYREESAGWLGGSRRLHTEIEVEVASALSRPVRVELLERVPVADDDDVTVEVTEARPATEPYEGERDGPILKGGRRQWLEVGPGAKVVGTLAYAVTLGSKQELVGGDRRG